MIGYKLIGLLLVSLFLVSACSDTKSSKPAKELDEPSQYGELPEEFTDEELQITMSSDQQKYSLPVTGIKVLLENTSSLSIGHSGHLFLEKREGDTWRPVPYQEHFAFADIGLGLEPGKTVEQELPLNYLDFEWTAGTYRIVKPIYVGENSKETPLAAQFEIEE